MLKPAAGHRARRRSRSRSEMRDFLLFLVKLSLVIFVVRSFIVAPFTIPSESMQPRLLIGDYLLAAKWPYGYSRYSLPFDVPLLPRRVLASQPARGDVVIFRAPPSNQRDYIKRVIGLPGDSVQVRGGQIILNGRPVPRARIADLVVPASPNSPCFSTLYREAAASGTGDVCRYPRFRETLPGGRSYETLDIGITGADDTRVFNVPAGHMFVMGDNRDRSEDSRFAVAGGGIGMVPQDNLIGKALVVVYSTDGSANTFLPWTWFTAVRGNRIGGGF